VCTKKGKVRGKQLFNGRQLEEGRKGGERRGSVGKARSLKRKGSSGRIPTQVKEEKKKDSACWVEKEEKRRKIARHKFPRCRYQKE